MPSYTCPFCGHTSPLILTTLQIYELSFDGPRFACPGYPRLMVKMFRCPNEKCKKDSVVVKGVDGYIDETFTYVYPVSKAIHFPEYVPEAIRKDYEEACAIYTRSPKAAATLARRCLQGMIRDFWGIKRKNLWEEISALKENIPPSQWMAIDALRGIGNIGAHMEKDVNTIIDIEPDEAESLIKLLELLLDKWYVSKHDEEELYKTISATAEEKSTLKETYRSSNGSQS